MATMVMVETAMVMVVAMMVCFGVFVNHPLRSGVPLNVSSLNQDVVVRARLQLAR